MFAYWLVFWCISFWTNTLLRLYRGGNLFSNYWKQMIFCYNSNSRWQHSDNKNLDSPYFTDNLNTPDNMSKNTHTKLFKLQFSGASGNNCILTFSGLKSLDFSPLFSLPCSILISNDNDLISIFRCRKVPVLEILQAVLHWSLVRYVIWNNGRNRNKFIL